MHALGKIVAYSADVNAGVIKSSTGKKLLFARSAWIGPGEPRADIAVTFRADGKTAQEVRPHS